MRSYLTLQVPTVRRPEHHKWDKGEWTIEVLNPQLTLVCNQDTEPEVLRNYLGAIWYMVSGRSVVDSYKVYEQNGTTCVVLTLNMRCVEDDSSWYRSFRAVQDIISHTNLLVVEAWAAPPSPH